MSNPSNSNGHRGWDVGVKQDTAGQLRTYHLQPWQFLFKRFRRLVIQLNEGTDLFRISVSVCFCNLDCLRREPRKVLTKFCRGLVFTQQADNFPRSEEH